MTDVEFAFFVILLAVAGNETTRNAMTHGMNAFFENPEQWELFKRERPETGGRRDHPLGHAGALFPAHRARRCRARRRARSPKGQRVGLFYSSANFDEDVFDRPFEFDILRNPNPHLAFGGNGAHFCIGANLARMEIKLIFNEIADQIPDIAKLAEPQRLAVGLDQRRQGAAGLLPADRLCQSCAPTAGPEQARLGRGGDRRILDAAGKAIEDHGADFSHLRRRPHGRGHPPDRLPVLPQHRRAAGGRRRARRRRLPRPVGGTPATASPIRPTRSPKPLRPPWSGCRGRSTSGCSWCPAGRRTSSR